MDKYTAVYSYIRKKWCVFEILTASIRVIKEECKDQGSAEELAQTLNDDATPQQKP